MTKENTRQKFRVYELDFGDTNLLSEDIKDITEWIANDMVEMGIDTPLDYHISIRMMTRLQISRIPEWA